VIYFIFFKKCGTEKSCKNESGSNSNKLQTVLGCLTPLQTGIHPIQGIIYQTHLHDSLQIPQSVPNKQAIAL